jgi:DAACS family dicarboxylate/amino acid:cation (Na+ or H+) symporter
MDDAPSTAARWNPLSWPLYLRVVLGVVIGAALGIGFQKEPIAFSWTNADLGKIATLYIQLLTSLATPLIFLAIVEAFVQTHISGRQGLKMFVICAINIAVAFAIGLTILNVWRPGAAWEDSLGTLAADLEGNGAPTELTSQVEKKSLSPLSLLQSYVPQNIVQPFAENMVLTVAVFGIFVGAALRSLQTPSEEDLAGPLQTFCDLIVVAYRLVLKMLYWLIEIAPIAICFAVAGVVGGIGLQVFQLVGVFFVTVIAALALHSLLYYPLTAWLIGGKSPLLYFGEGAGAILTGFSINSSLATAPLTLGALKRMNVSDSAARLSACVGTNFNNDGITLYEAITALFVAQAAGMDLSLAQQISILLAALAGSMGIAGIPNSGLIILTLVLKAAKLPEETVALALPIVYSIDFINARVRSAVNVMGDLQVAILLDAGGEKKPALK